jgi:hypothetical protein
MAEPVPHIDVVASIAESLADLGLHPVIIGSQRVTRDFDFVIAQPAERLERVVDVFYDRGFELVSRLNEAKHVTATIDNRRVAAIRLRIDAPASAFFFNTETRLRIDVMFDFPLPAVTLADHATSVKIRSRVLPIASEDDLLRLKRMAYADRSAPGDAEDIAFLEARRARK